MLRTIAILFTGLLASAAVSAADHGVYLGAAISQSSVDVHNTGSIGRIDGSDTKFKVIGGVRALNWLAFEANYVDFGTVDTASGTPATSSGNLRLKGIDAFALGLFEVTVVDFYAKAGLVRWDSSISLNSVTASNDTTGSDFAYGGGVQAHFGSLSVRAEYEKFDIPNTNNVSLISVGLTWTFL